MVGSERSTWHPGLLQFMLNNYLVPWNSKQGQFQIANQRSLVSGLIDDSIFQVMADLALNAVADKEVSTLTINEQRRLAIGLELVRDPGTVGSPIL